MLARVSQWGKTWYGSPDIKEKRPEKKKKELHPQPNVAYHMGSVTAITSGRDRFVFSSGQNSALSSYRHHHRWLFISFLIFAARLRRMVGAYVSLTKNMRTKLAPEQHMTTQLVQRQPRY